MIFGGSGRFAASRFLPLGHAFRNCIRGVLLRSRSDSSRSRFRKPGSSEETSKVQPPAGDPGNTAWEWSRTWRSAGFPGSLCSSHKGCALAAKDLLDAGEGSRCAICSLRRTGTSPLCLQPRNRGRSADESPVDYRPQVRLISAIFLSIASLYSPVATWYFVPSTPVRMLSTALAG